MTSHRPADTMLHKTVRVAQLVRAPDCGSGCWGFESPLSPQESEMLGRTPKCPSLILGGKRGDSMGIDEKVVDYVARLSRIRLEGPEKQRLAEQLGRIVAYVEKLKELDTDDVEPLAHPLETTNVFREDKEKESLSVEEALKNAPDSGDGFFQVPAVID